MMLEERDESGMEDDSSSNWEEISEEISERGRRKGKLIIKNSRGGVTYVYNTRKVNVPDATKMKVVCGRWEICATGKESCIELDSNCPCTRAGAFTSSPTAISKAKLLDEREC
eukprot:sb/3476963/